MKIKLETILALLTLGCLHASVLAQKPANGFLPEIEVQYVTGSQRLVIYDYVSGQTSIASPYQLNEFYNEQGVYRWRIGPTGKAIVYDVNLQTWMSYSKSSNFTAMARGGGQMAVWITSSNALHAAIYNPILQSWQSRDFTASSNLYQVAEETIFYNNQGNIIGVKYNPTSNSWDVETLFSSPSNQIQIIDAKSGSAAFRASSTLGAAFYDQSRQDWVTLLITGIPTTTSPPIASAPGFVAAQTLPSTLFLGAYDVIDGDWKTSYITTDGNIIQVQFGRGTAYVRTSTGLTTYGYDYDTNLWTAGTYTKPYCHLTIWQPSPNPNGFVVLSSEYIGGGFGGYDCEDDHLVTKRTAVKQFREANYWFVGLKSEMLDDTLDCSGHVYISSSVGIHDEAYSSLEIFPNPLPRNGQLHVRAPKALKIATIYDQLGRIVFRDEITGTEAQLDLPNLGAGVYFLVGNAQNGQEFRSKFLVE